MDLASVCAKKWMAQTDGLQRTGPSCLCYVPVQIDAVDSYMNGIMVALTRMVRGISGRAHCSFQCCSRSPPALQHIIARNRLNTLPRLRWKKWQHRMTHTERSSHHYNRAILTPVRLCTQIIARRCSRTRYFHGG